MTADTDKNKELYDVYAEKYDHILKVTGFNDHAMVVKYIVDNNYPKTAKIIDFGCGTGPLGALLAEAGYTNVAGVDGSAGMLEQAQAK